MRGQVPNGLTGKSKKRKKKKEREKKEKEEGGLTAN